MSEMNRVASMTGFASVQSVTKAGTLTVELRSVNSRFLDLHFRMNDDLRIVEPLLREKLNAGLARGKVECRISWGRGEQTKQVPSIDVELIKQLAKLESQIQAAMPQLSTFRTTDILNWPGVVEDTSLSNDELQSEISSLCDQALDQLKQNRLREGGQLLAVLNEKIDAMQSIVETLEPQVPEFVAAYEKKIREKMTDALDRVISEKTEGLSVSDIEERIKHEVSLYSVRVDVKEELDRLVAHFKEVRRVLSKGGVIGKRLDFIAQELNRESNTLGSKAHAFAQTQSSIDLKVLVEQFREQIQNIE
ncbi:MAG: YicC/YloC family endoribonuclease [Limnobacter sp.]|nr:YicC/YloC family endoribonuclease [Limnobacter sp.]